jgi:hypothetical protein
MLEEIVEKGIYSAYAYLDQQHKQRRRPLSEYRQDDTLRMWQPADSGT